MSRSTSNRGRVAGVAAAAALALVLAGCSGGSSEGGGGDGDGPVELTLLTGTVETNVVTMQALADAFNEANPDVTITLDSSMPGGSEGDNLIKTRLATGEVPDMFYYNSGSLLQALNPDQTLLNIADEDFVDRLAPTYLETVSTENGVYGVSAEPATGGGLLYSIPIYEELGLEVPTTWDEFMANNDAIKAAGYDPVLQSYADTWTSQFFILANFYNMWSNDPEWADKYTANEVSYSSDPVALKGFQNIQELHDGGYLNEDFASATYDDALRKLATGEGAHYPMATFALSQIFSINPDAREDIGFFALPGDGDNGLTVWMPHGLYAPKDTPHPDAVKRFMDFVASPDGCDAVSAAIEPPGVYLVDGCTLPEGLPRAVTDMLPYFEDEGATVSALEFLSPIKGPALDQICVEVGSGIRSAEEAAAMYDEDVRKQAEQLGLDGW